VKNNSDPRLARRHILVVDDDSRILTLLKKFLQQNGFSVSTSTSANEATTLLENFIFDLIILDVMLPEITGIEFAEKINSRGNEVPIVMLTALSTVEDKIKGLEAGAKDYMTKPFEPKELLLRINNLLELYDSHKKSAEFIRLGNASYNRVTKEFIKNHSAIKLGNTETKILDVLINAGKQGISREELALKLGVLSLRSVDVAIVRLRYKTEDDPKNPQFLKTIRNFGYVLYV
jgi:two-component system phosphate regulon response regulator OmpR